MKKKLRGDLRDLLTGPSSTREPMAPQKPRCRITIELEKDTLVILSNDVTIELDRDYADATSWANPNRVYIAGKRGFTIKGSLL